jgi:hypothetical protein
MRDSLVRRQAKTGTASGSWMLKGQWDEAGRLYCTAMAAITLEVYYRYQPIYSEDAVQVRIAP